MKRRLTVIIITIIWVLTLFIATVYLVEKSKNKTDTPVSKIVNDSLDRNLPSSVNDSGLRGLWVASVNNIDYPSERTQDSKILKAKAIEILDYAKDTGFNAVFLQVHPSADALYKSKYFPWSYYLTGKQGLMPDNDFDPLAFWIKEAHIRGIELHAWVNPYRVTKNNADDPLYKPYELDPKNPAVLNPDWTVRYSDENLYFNPGIPEVKNLIIDGVLEIVENYEVDGIHFDDYFYPGKDFDDNETFSKYGTGFDNIDDWRRSNVNTLISELSKKIKSSGKKVQFGISPSGIWANKKSNPLGSDTDGRDSYYEQYADTRKWVKDGLIDYIAPQLYWNIGYSIADYSTLVSWWKDVVDETDVDLYIGQAAYRSGDPDTQSPWYGIAEIERQLNLNSKEPVIKGSIFFNYKAISDNKALSELLKAMFKAKNGSISDSPIKIARPSGNIKTSYDKFYLNGSSDPSKPLYLNGNQVESRSSKGYFGVLVNLDYGANIFTLSQEGSYTYNVIYRENDNSAQKEMSVIEIPEDSVFPKTKEYRMPGEKITLSCRAPIGSKVSVKIGKSTYNMTPDVKTTTGTGTYSATYTCTYTLPSYEGSPRNIDLGKPIYKMEYNGITKTRTAPSNIGVIMENSPFYAKVINDVIDTYIAPVTGNGAKFEIYKDMVDYVTAISGNYIRLSCGQWVKSSSVIVYPSKSQLSNTIKNITYTSGDKWDELNIDMSSSVVTTAAFEGNSIKLNISNASSADLPVIPNLPDNSLFSSMDSEKTGKGVRYNLKLKESERIDGYYIEKTTKGICLRAKHHVVSRSDTKPLSDITIMIDPGHGGNESGAIGPLGFDYAEKRINLGTAIKLRSELVKLGANVVMTREEDIDVSLQGRLAACRKTRPDLFISLHADSRTDNTDISKIFGFSVYYREIFSEPVAEKIYNNAIKGLNKSERGIHKNNFYVNRGTWTPSILIETGFVPNPYEFELLTDENSQTEIAKNITKSILEYFKEEA